MTKVHVTLVFGTRPEAIKLAPVHAELVRRADRFETEIIVTGQHRQMLDQMLGVFGMQPRADLDVMVEAQSPAGVAARVLDGLKPLLAESRPDIILVQGDTTTVFAAALAAFYERIQVGHVEAGLRTGNRHSPFPEEINRRLTSQLADLHFAATERARQNLLRADVDAGSIYLTGNPIVDALRQISAVAPPLAQTEFSWLEQHEGRLIVVTFHRRENLGVPLVRICEALREITARYPDVLVVYPVHPNPVVRKTVSELLGGAERIRLTEPADYMSFVPLLARADVVITDSGGLQEEAPALGVPVIVTRDTTERPEGIEAGVAKLVGTETRSIVEAAAELLESPGAYRAMQQGGCPYGDGQAAGRIADAIEFHFGITTVRPPEFVCEQSGA